MCIMQLNSSIRTVRLSAAFSVRVWVIWLKSAVIKSAVIDALVWSTTMIRNVSDKSRSSLSDVSIAKKIIQSELVSVQFIKRLLSGSERHFSSDSLSLQKTTLFLHYFIRQMNLRLQSSARSSPSLRMTLSELKNDLKPWTQQINSSGES